MKFTQRIAIHESEKPKMVAEGYKVSNYNGSTMIAEKEVENRWIGEGQSRDE